MISLSDKVKSFFMILGLAQALSPLHIVCDWGRDRRETRTSIPGAYKDCIHGRLRVQVGAKQAYIS